MKEASKLTSAELSELMHMYMLEFANQGTRPSDRDGSQRWNTRLWYDVVTQFLARQESKRKRDDQGLQ